jgi:hypothetical protein
MIRRYATYIAIIILVSILVRVMLVGTSSEVSGFTIFEFIRPAGRIYLRIFGHPNTAIILSLTMFGLFLALLAALVFGQLLPTYRALSAALARLRAINTIGSESDARDQIRRAIAPAPLLSDAWRSYDASLINRRARSGANSTARASNFFNLRALETMNVKVRQFAPVPNYFVGLGLVLTFMGLVAGLYFASVGIRSGSLDDARNALVNLLSASTFKFATSVTGIGASLVFSVVLRTGSHALESLLDQICKQLEILLPPVTALNLLQDISDKADEQISAIKSLVSTLEQLSENPGGSLKSNTSR